MTRLLLRIAAWFLDDLALGLQHGLARIPRRAQLIAVWTLPSAILLLATLVTYSVFRIRPPDRLDADERAAVMRPLRGAVAGPPAARCDVQRAGDPIVVTVWLGGRAIARVDASEPRLADAVDAAAASLRALPAITRLSPADRARARIQVDLITGTGPLGGTQGAFDTLAVPGIGNMLAINPGVEGIGANLGTKQTLMLPGELVNAKLLTAKRPSDAMPDFAMGIDLGKIQNLLGQRSGQKIVAPPSSLFRFRTDTFVESAAGILPLYRGNPPPPPLSGQALRDAALAGGRYLVAHQGANGRYVYEHDLATGQQTDPLHSQSYSMPRHAGTTYFLSELYRITKQPWLREPIERAFAHLSDLLAANQCGGPDFACVMDKTESTAQLGSTALTVVALAEYQRATGDARYLPLAKRLAAFVLWMQRPDGSFRHIYNPATKLANETEQLFYYSGEAALALARMHVVTGDPIYAKATERALDWLVDWYDFFMGGFFYGEEHWTCIAAEAIWPAVQHEKYVDFCHGYGAFLRAQQPELGEHPDEDDLAGAYNVTPFVPPYNTPAGSRTEAMISAYLLGKHSGEPDARVAGQIRAALQYALGQQIRPDNDFAVVGPGDGGMPGSPIERNVRIDYVQHVCSAMIRASEWIDEP